MWGGGVNSFLALHSPLLLLVLLSLLLLLVPLFLLLVLGTCCAFEIQHQCIAGMGFACTNWRCAGARLWASSICHSRKQGAAGWNLFFI